MSSGPTRLLLNKITVNHNGSPPFFDRMPLVYVYNTMPDIVTAVGLSDDTKNKLRTEADQRLTYPGSRPPGRTASTAAARLSRLNAKFVYPWDGWPATSVTTHPIGRAHRIMIQS